MPKMKTNRGAAKRFKKVAGGKKIKRATAFKRHILTAKATKRKRRLRKSVYVHETNEKAIRLLLPY
jgi:large subunit ribosomal protein L35